MEKASIIFDIICFPLLNHISASATIISFNFFRY